MTLLLGIALAECGDIETSIANLEAAPSKENYDCLAHNEDSAERLVERLEEGENERLSRALAVWRMLRLKAEISDEESRAYSPADRRLLVDAIHGQHGRETPAPSHAAVFEQFAWYQPDPAYTDGRLTELDRSNISKLNSPPEPPAPAEEALAPEPSPQAPTELESCGCGGGVTGAWLALFGLMALRRR